MLEELLAIGKAAEYDAWIINIGEGDQVNQSKLTSNAAIRGYTSGCSYLGCESVTNLPLTSKQKFRFGLVCPGQARLKRNFCFDVNGRFVTT